MPNHITNIVKTSPEVIQKMLNDENKIDFAKIIPFGGVWPWDFVCFDAEELAAKVVLHINEVPLIEGLLASNRRAAGMQDLPNEESFEQFVQMLRNYRATGFLHCMDFARNKWGTKWNAYSQVIDTDAGTAKFCTAWRCPFPIFLQLSASNPSQLIEVRFADEDIGSNCGTVKFQAGFEVYRDVADRWDNMTVEQQEQWKAFAYEVTGFDAKEATCLS